MKGFQISSQLTSCKPLHDKGMSVIFHTKECTNEDKLEIINALDEAGWLLFKENEIKGEEIPKQDSEFEIKTPSQRLRGCLFRLWKKYKVEKNIKVEFEDFYKMQMEKAIQRVKDLFS